MKDLHRYILESVIFELYNDIKPSVKLRGTQAEVTAILESITACQDLHETLHSKETTLDKIKEKIETYHKSVDIFNEVISEDLEWPL